MLNRTDLIVVGSGSSGKTTLIHRLKTNTFLNESSMTDGIEIKNLYIGPVRFTVRDFAGQQVYTHTHSLFFKEDALYLAVFNPRVENNIEALSQFLHMIKDKAPNAKVALATTLCDEVEIEPFMSQQLIERFPTLLAQKRFFPVDSKSGNGFTKLKEFLLKKASRRPGCTVPVPLRTSLIMDRIASLANISKTTFAVSENEINNLNPSIFDREIVLKSLIDDFGILYKLSNGQYLIRPQDHADILACVVTKVQCEETSKENGILNHNEENLSKIWGNRFQPKNLWYTEGALSPFLRLLHDSGLAYESFDTRGEPQNKSIVPCMLGAGPKDFHKDTENVMDLMTHFFPDKAEGVLEKLEVFFSFLPITFFAQLLSRLQAMAVTDGVWRHGAVFSAGVSYALLMERKGSLEIALIGSNRSVRSMILIEIMKLKDKFHSMVIADMKLTVEDRTYNSKNFVGSKDAGINENGTNITNGNVEMARRRWNADDILDALLNKKGKLSSSMNNNRITRVFSLLPLFPMAIHQTLSTQTKATSVPMNATDEHVHRLQNLLMYMEIQGTYGRTTDFIVMLNDALECSLLPLLTNMGLITSDGKPRPLWVILRNKESHKHSAIPYSPHYVPDEPWFAVEEAHVPLPNFLDRPSSVSSDLIKTAFSFMRNDLKEMIPDGWEWAEVQSLIGIDLKALEQKEKMFFCSVKLRKDCFGRSLWINFKDKAKAQNCVPQNLKVNI